MQLPDRDATGAGRTADTWPRIYAWPTRCEMLDVEMTRTLIAAILMAGCTAHQGQIARNLGVGLFAEGLAVGVVAHVTRDPADSTLDSVRSTFWTAAPLLIAGAALGLGGQIAASVRGR
jgi:hypothetical protein